MPFDALDHTQARSRMVFSYKLASLSHPLPRRSRPLSYCSSRRHWPSSAHVRGVQAQMLATPAVRDISFLLVLGSVRLFFSPVFPPLVLPWQRTWFVRQCALISSILSCRSPVAVALHILRLSSGVVLLLDELLQFVVGLLAGHGTFSAASATCSAGGREKMSTK